MGHSEDKEAGVLCNARGNFFVVARYPVIQLSRFYAPRIYKLERACSSSTRFLATSADCEHTVQRVFYRTNDTYLQQEDVTNWTVDANYPWWGWVLAAILVFSSFVFIPICAGLVWLKHLTDGQIDICFPWVPETLYIYTFIYCTLDCIRHRPPLLIPPPQSGCRTRSTWSDCPTYRKQERREGRIGDGTICLDYNWNHVLSSHIMWHKV